MPREFHSSPDFNENPLLGVVPERLPAHPPNPSQGRHYFNLVEQVAYYYDGEGWVAYGDGAHDHADKADAVHTHPSDPTKSDVDHDHPEKADATHDHDGQYDPAGTAAAGDSQHVADPDPHPQYMTTSSLVSLELSPPSDTVEDETSWGQSPSEGDLLDNTFSRGTHTHGSPADPIPPHIAASDPHGDRAHAEAYAEAYADTQDASHSAADRAYTDTQDAAHVSDANPHTQYLRSDTNDSASGQLTFTGKLRAQNTVLFSDGNKEPYYIPAAATFEGPNNGTGCIVINTGANFVSVMHNLHVKAYLYNEAASLLDLSMGGYDYSVSDTLLQKGWMNRGARSVSRVRWGVETSTGNLVYIIGETTDDWDYLQLRVEALFGFSANVARFDNVSVSLEADLTPYSKVAAVPEMTSAELEDHTSDADPHTQYLQTDHTSDADPHTQYLQTDDAPSFLVVRESLDDYYGTGKDGLLVVRAGQEVFLHRDMHYRQLIMEGGTIYTNGFRVCAFQFLQPTTTTESPVIDYTNAVAVENNIFGWTFNASYDNFYGDEAEPDTEGWSGLMFHGRGLRGGRGAHGAYNDRADRSRGNTTLALGGAGGAGGGGSGSSRQSPISGSSASGPALSVSHFLDDQWFGGVGGSGGGRAVSGGTSSDAAGGTGGQGGGILRLGFYMIGNVLATHRVVLRARGEAGAPGGGPGTPYSTGGGGGGGGGVVMLAYTQKSPSVLLDRLIIDVAGGPGGPKSHSGGNGASGGAGKWAVFQVSADNPNPNL